MKVSIKIKPQHKILLFLLVAVALVISTTMGTLAWLTSQTETLTNTFTYGQVVITMDEASVNEYGEVNPQSGRVTENTYKLIPGHTYVKDPTIHVDDDSENCFIFVKITNGLVGKNGDSFASFTLTDLPADDSVNGSKLQWVEYSTEDNETVYYLNGAVLPGSDVNVFKQFTFSSAVGSEEISALENSEITLVGYAIQAEGFTDENGGLHVDTAWQALENASKF